MALLGLAADVSQNAAVGVQDLTVYKVGSVACKEHAGAHHVVRLTPAACFSTLISRTSASMWVM